MSGLPFTETVTSAAKRAAAEAKSGEGSPGPASIRRYVDLGLIPSIRDANGRRLLRIDAPELLRTIYAERAALRGRPRKVRAGS